MQSDGFSLVELLVALVVAGLLASAALPPMLHLVDRQRAAARTNQVIGAVQLARASAITLNERITLCPSAGPGCSGRNTWQEGMLIFADRNSDGRLDADENVIRRLPPMATGVQIYWRSFRNRGYLQFLPSGLTPWQNGHFLICPADGNARYARQIILNAAGRLRMARDADGDGIPEDVRGRPLSC